MLMHEKIMKILVVDDVSTMRQIVKKSLKQLGFENVEEAADGRQALDKLRAGGFGFMVTDLYMPNMDGLDLMKTIRQDPSLKDLPILMVTAESKKDKVIMAIQAGANSYVVKPFTLEIFREKIERVLAQIGKL